MLDVHGPPQLILFWGRLSRKQSFSRCNIPCPSQSSRGAPVSFSLSQRYLQLPPPLPPRPFLHTPSSFFPPTLWAPGKTLPPITALICCHRLRRTGNNGVGGRRRSVGLYQYQTLYRCHNLAQYPGLTFPAHAHGLSLLALSDFCLEEPSPATKANLQRILTTTELF